MHELFSRLPNLFIIPELGSKRPRVCFSSPTSLMLLLVMRSACFPF